MADKNHSSNNWVVARAKCNGKETLKILLDRVKYDVNQINKIECSINFRIDEEEGQFSITPEGNGNLLVERGAVTFTQNSYKIRVRNSRDEVDSFFVKWHWDTEAMACYYCVNKERKELWEISQMALSPSFFPDEAAN